MACENPDCLGNYDFEHIATFARKRFIEGFPTMTLLQQANSTREREEIALVSLLDVENDQIKDLQLSCRYDQECEVVTCRDRLKAMIESELSV